MVEEYYGWKFNLPDKKLPANCPRSWAIGWFGIKYYYFYEFSYSLFQFDTNDNHQVQAQICSLVKWVVY